MMQSILVRKLSVLLVLVGIVLAAASACLLLGNLGQVKFRNYQPVQYPPGSGLVRVIGIEGKTFDSLIADRGQPTNLVEISIDDARSEERCELLNWYPPDHWGNRNVRFLEAVWERDGFTTFIWFHRVHGEWIGLAGYTRDGNIRS